MWHLLLGPPIFHTIVHVAEVAGAADAHGLVGLFQHHTVLATLAADNTPAETAVVLANKEREGLHAGLAFQHFGVGDPDGSRLEVCDGDLLGWDGIVAGPLRHGAGQSQRLDEVLPEGDAGDRAWNAVGRADGVRLQRTGHLEEGEDGVEGYKVGGGVVRRAGRACGDAQAAQALLDLLCVSRVVGGHGHALRGGNGGGGQPVDGVQLEELAQALAVGAAQAEVQLGLKGVSRFGEGQGA